MTVSSRCSSSKVLLTLCEHVTSRKDDQSLRELQDYLEARLLILKNIPVCYYDLLHMSAVDRLLVIGTGQGSRRRRGCYQCLLKARDDTSDFSLFCQHHHLSAGDLMYRAVPSRVFDRRQTCRLGENVGFYSEEC